MIIRINWVSLVGRKRQQINIIKELAAAKMTRFLTVLILWMILCAYGEKADTIRIKHKQEKYYLTKTCYYILEWDEVILKSNSSANKINSEIRKRVSSFKLSDDDIKLFCQKEMDYTIKFEMLYLKNNIISIGLSRSVYIKDTPHPWTEFETMNFDSETGMEINFRTLFDNTKISSIDSLILKKATQEREFSGMDLMDLKQSIDSKKFNFANNGINIIFIYQNYPLDVLLTYEELRPFVLKEGPLKKIYKNTK